MKPAFLALTLLLLGCCLLAYALTMPYYTNQVAANRLLTGGGKQEYYEAEAKLRTNKTTLLDVGSGLAVMATVVLAFAVATRTRHFTDACRLRTPTALVILLCANAAWLLMIPGTWWYYSYRAARGDYPPFADTIIIPIMSQTTFLLTALLPLNILLGALLVKARLPTHLLIKPARYTALAIWWEVLFSGLLLLTVLLLGLFVYDGDHIAIITFCTLSYLVLSLRAGRVGPLKST